MLTKTWSSRKCHSLPVGMQNCTVTLEDSLVVSYNGKHSLTYMIHQSHTLIFTQMS